MALIAALWRRFAGWRALVWLKRWQRRQDASEFAAGRYFLWLGRAAGRGEGKR